MLLRNTDYHYNAQNLWDGVLDSKLHLSCKKKGTPIICLINSLIRSIETRACPSPGTAGRLGILSVIKDGALPASGGSASSPEYFTRIPECPETCI